MFLHTFIGLYVCQRRSASCRAIFRRFRPIRHSFLPVPRSARPISALLFAGLAPDRCASSPLFGRSRVRACFRRRPQDSTRLWMFSLRCLQCKASAFDARIRTSGKIAFLDGCCKTTARRIPRVPSCAGAIRVHPFGFCVHKAVGNRGAWRASCPRKPARSNYRRQRRAFRTGIGSGRRFTPVFARSAHSKNLPHILNEKRHRILNSGGAAENQRRESGRNGFSKW